VPVLARRLEGAIEDALGELLSYATELALAAARAVIGHAAADPRVLEHSLRQALEQLAGLLAVEVRVNPEDLATARELVGRLRRGPRVDLVGDETVGRGGCVARTDLGEVDAAVESQTRRLAEVLGLGGEG
jgi:flagellar biosynthesis/type III secretory pathway protein FliH